MSRPLTERERDVLDALLAVEIDGVERLRHQASSVVVVGRCDCGCPSIDFRKDPGTGMHTRVNAKVEGTSDGLFLYTVGDRLGGIEWVGTSNADPTEFPDPAALVISPA